MNGFLRDFEISERFCSLMCVTLLCSQIFLQSIQTNVLQSLNISANALHLGRIQLLVLVPTVQLLITARKPLMHTEHPNEVKLDRTPNHLTS